MIQMIFASRFWFPQVLLVSQIFFLLREKITNFWGPMLTFLGWKTVGKLGEPRRDDSYFPYTIPSQMKSWSPSCILKRVGFFFQKLL